jgi:SPP1 gp7 family putative phage head morphogenesis protein
MKWTNNWGGLWPWKSAATQQEAKLRAAIERLEVAKQVQTAICKPYAYSPRVFAADKHIADWKAAVDASVSGPYYRKDSLWEVIRQISFDGQIKTQRQTRLNGTLAEPWRLGIEANEPTKGLIKKAVRVVLDSLLYWASAMEVADDGSFYVVPSVFLVPETESLVVSNFSTGTPWAAYENLLVFVNPDEDFGLLTYAAQYAIYKRFSVSDWSRHSELFGMPFLSLKTPITETKALQERHKALSEFGRNAYVILDPDEDLTAIDTKSNGSPHELYDRMIKFCDEQISKCLVGQTATSDTKSFVGSAEVQERILDWYVEADMRYVEEQMNQKVLPHLKKLGLLPEAAVFEWEYFVARTPQAAPSPDSGLAHSPKDTPPTPLKRGAGLPADTNNGADTSNGDKDTPPTLLKRGAGTSVAYAAYLEGLKKKSPNRLRLRLDFGKLWGEQDFYPLFEQYLKRFYTPVKQGLPNESLTEKFRENAYQFALAKAATFVERTKGMSQAEAKKVMQAMNQHLETEQTAFVMAAQAAVQWQRLVRGEDLFPNLTWRTVGDANVRDSHARLNGITKPLRDDFWQRYFPPIDYNCRCTVRQSSASATLTDGLPAGIPQPAPGLGHNPGESGKAFDFEHPYFGYTTSAMRSNVAAFSKYAVDKNYKPIYFHLDVKKSGFVVQHKQAYKADLAENLIAAKVLARYGMQVEIRQHKENDGKNPELTINGRISDLKTNETENQFKVFVNAFNSARSQRITECVVSLSDEYKPYDADLLFEGLRQAFKNKEKMERVMVLWEGRFITIERKQVINADAKVRYKAKARLSKLIK